MRTQAHRAHTKPITQPQRRNFKGATVIGAAVGLFSFMSNVFGQATFTWGTNSGTAWATGANWLGGVPAGSTSATNNDVALFNSSGTTSTIGLNFSNLGTPYYLGAIVVNSNNRTFGSNGGTPGTLVLNGATIGGQNLFAQVTAASLTLTLAPTNSGGTGAMSVQLNSSGAFDTGAGTIAISAALTESAGASKSITKNGSGTLIFAGATSYTGTTTITAGTLQIGAGGAGGTIGSGNIINNAALAVARSGSVSLDNDISGTGSLYQNGTGTLLLNGTNTYGGITQISAGTLVANTGSALPGGTTLTFNNTTGSATLVVANGVLATVAAINLPAPFAGSANPAAQIAAGSGTLSLGGDLTYTGNTSSWPLNISGNLNLTAGAHTFSILSNGNVGRGGDVQIGAVIGGPGSLSKVNTGMLALNAPNTYTGGSALSAGTLALGSSTTLSGLTIVSGPLGTGSLSVSGGTLTANTAARTVANPIAVSGNFNIGGAQQLTLSGPVDLGAATRTISNFGTNSAGTGYSAALNGVIGGSGGLTIAGPGNGTVLNLLVGGGSTYTGITTVQRGVVNPTAGVLAGQNGPFGNAATAVLLGDTGGSNFAGILLGADNLSFSRPIAVQVGGTGIVYIGSVANGGSFSGAITVPNLRTLSLYSGATDITIASQITGAGGVTMSAGPATTGLINLTHASSNYTGSTSVPYGILGVGANAPSGSAGALGNATSAVTLGGDAAALTYSGLWATASNITIGRAVTVSSSNAQNAYVGSDIDQSLSNVTFSNTLTLNKTASLVGADVTYSGQITGSGGIVGDFGTVSKLTNPTNNFNGNVTFTSGAGNGGKIIAAANNALGNTTGSTTVIAGSALGFAGNINYTAGENVSIIGTGVGGAGAIENVSGTNIFAGPVAMSGDSSIGVTSGQLTLSGLLSGNFNLSKVGSGTLVLANSSTNVFGLNKTTTISSGALAFAVSAQLGNDSNAIAIGNAILSLNSSGTAMVRPVTLVAGASATIDVSSPTGVLSLSQNGASAVSGASGASLTKTGPGTLAMNRPATYTGSTTIANGTLRIGGGNDRLPVTTSMTIGDAVANTSGQFDLNGWSQTIAGLNHAGAGAGNQVVNGIATPSVLTVNQATATTSNFAGRLGGGAGSNAFALTKSGNGRLILGGANTYTGDTNVSGGTLLINGTHAGGGNYSIAAAATIGGSGTISFSSAHTFTLNGKISPGTGGTGPGGTGGSIGAFTLGANATTTLPAGGMYVWEMNNQTGSAGSQWDLLALNAVNLTAPGGTVANKFIIKLVSLTPGNDPGHIAGWDASVFSIWPIATFSSGLVAIDVSKFELDTSDFIDSFGAGGLHLRITGNSIELVNVPEPATLLQLFALPVLLRRRRRSKGH